MLQPAVGPSAMYLEDDLLEAAQIAFVSVQHLHLPAVALGVAAVNAVEIAGEQRGLIAARCRADLDDDVLLVELVFRDESQPELFLKRLDLRLVSLDLLARHSDQLMVAALADDLARLGQRPLEPAHFADDA